MNGIDINKVKKAQVKAEEKSFLHDIIDLFNKDLSLFGSKLSDKKKEVFHHKLGILDKSYKTSVTSENMRKQRSIKKR
ncbi:hypothetical protein MYP_4070 [Sporocytophaga myxococcoides]|uniref:Uncharacterized protein n=1 Tax=Sporocytophaga myxococcoides TaxID=153721 RepID=A0A098LIS1_9BACT|nr:hypothetical protein [Sporocytophaga myxococcoides]GAL86840.1 hypothetical protein MYP_4070 [Sporocytophaga myxococcoides]